MDLQEIVRRLRMNQSIKAIKRETGKHRSVIRRVRELAEQEGWLDAARAAQRAAAPRAVPRTAAGRARRRTPVGCSPRSDRRMARRSLQLPGHPQTGDGAGGGVLGEHRAPLHPPALPEGGVARDQARRGHGFPNTTKPDQAAGWLQASSPPIMARCAPAIALKTSPLSTKLR